MQEYKQLSKQQKLRGNPGSNDVTNKSEVVKVIVLLFVYDGLTM